jgi:hypothetical protein
MDNAELAGIQQIVDSGRFPFTIGQMRNFLLNRHKNGLDRATYKIGKRIYLKVSCFQEWIEKQKGGRS